MKADSLSLGWFSFFSLFGAAETNQNEVLGAETCEDGPLISAHLQQIKEEEEADSIDLN